MLLLIYIIIIVLTEAAAQSVIQYCEIHNAKKYLFVSLIFYAIGAVFLYLAYKERKIGIINVFSASLSIILMLVIGVIFFKEKITINEYIGVALIIVGICIIESKKYLK